MRQALAIGHNDLRLFLRNRLSLVWLLVVPLAFVYFMGFANRGPGDPANPRPGVLVDNRDRDYLSRALLAELGAQGLTVLDPTNRDQARRGIEIPADFTERVVRGDQGRVRFFTLAESGLDASALVELRLVRALIALNSHLIEHAGAHGGELPDEAALEGLRQKPNPVSLDARFAGRKPIPVGFALSVPGVLVMYLMLNLLVFGGAAVASERRSGLMRRFLMQPLSRGALIMGKVYGLVLLGAVQVAVFLVLGQFVFKVELGSELPGILLTLMIYSWMSASLGVLIGSVITSEDKVTGLCVLASMVMAALGGCWWPLEVVPESIRTLAHFFPTAWALDALHQMITFGGGFAAAGSAIGVLVLFGLAANLAAVKLFRP
ncbi:MAG: ABC transporter permease [Verrucomicrobia bacterium]|nr:ABC transporter permease [Verrucomicrobiota bacterium]